jgi:hypothetical protein
MPPGVGFIVRRSHSTTYIELSTNYTTLKEDMVKHLPQAVKHLLTLRNPEVWPSPPLGRLHNVFNRTLKEAKERNAEDGWLVLSVRMPLAKLLF